MMTFNNLEDITQREVVPGFFGRFIHNDHVTMAFWNVDSGATLPDHAHPHDQMTTVIEGQFELTVAGETRIVQMGDVAVIPGGVHHSGRALTVCQLIDVFYPAREDYQQKDLK